MRAVLVLLLGAASASAQPTRGGVWSAVGTDEVVRALATAPGGGVYAGGEFRTVAGVTAGPVARWDGTTWQAMGALDGQVEALAVGAGGEVLAAGYLTGLGEEGFCAARWDGAEWTRLGTDCAELNEIYAATLLPDGTPVVGGRHYGDVRGIVRWTGEAWTDLGSGSTGRLRGNVWALAVGPDGVLYAGGEFLRTGTDTDEHCMARWDGTAWETISPNLHPGSSFGECVWALELSPDGTLYAGGDFFIDGTTARQGAARWDGTAWTALHAYAGVWDLAFAAGGLLYAGHIDAPELTVWDGAAWTAVGGAAGGAVYALAPDGSDGLFVGGYFSGIGGVASPYLVRYTVPPVATEAPPGSLAFAFAPNSAAGPVRMVAPRAGRVDVLDTQGRTVQTFDVAAGDATLSTGGLAPGLYLVRLTSGADVAARMLVVSQ